MYFERPLGIDNPLFHISKRRFDELMIDLEPYFSSEAERLGGKFAFPLSVACKLIFPGVPPILQQELLRASTGNKLNNFPHVFFDDQIRDLDLFLGESCKELLGNNQAVSDQFYQWVISSPDLPIEPILDAGSRRLPKINPASFDYAINSEIPFNEQLRIGLGNNKILCEAAHMALIKAIGLWMWKPLLCETDQHQSILLEIDKRIDVLESLILLSYGENIPVMWGMATERLTSTKQMIVLGLRLWGEESSIFGDFNTTILENKDLSYRIECDYGVNMYGNGSLMLDYSRMDNGLHDWVYNNVKDGLKSIRKSALIICLELADKLEVCGCGDDDGIILGVRGIASETKAMSVSEKRKRLTQFSEDNPIPEGMMPSDLYEHPIIFKAFENNIELEVVKLCNYVAWWWYGTCEHSPNEEDVRLFDRMEGTKEVFNYLDEVWPSNREHIDITEGTRGKTISKVIKSALGVIRKEKLLTADQISEVMACWPWINSWEVDFVDDDY